MPFFVINAIFVIIVINAIFVTKKIQNMRPGQKPILTPHTLKIKRGNG